MQSTFYQGRMGLEPVWNGGVGPSCSPRTHFTGFLLARCWWWWWGGGCSWRIDGRRFRWRNEKKMSKNTNTKKKRWNAFVLTDGGQSFRQTRGRHVSDPPSTRGNNNRRCSFRAELFRISDRIPRPKIPGMQSQWRTSYARRVHGGGPTKNVKTRKKKRTKKKTKTASDLDWETEKGSAF